MIKFKRYYTAIPRYKRSKGFGIHSPFAFNFVLKVLRERCPYYAYEIINAARWEASRLASSAKERRNLLSFKNAKMIFRITCHFNPSSILQIGTSHGVASTAPGNDHPSHQTSAVAYLPTTILQQRLTTTPRNSPPRIAPL